MSTRRTAILASMLGWAMVGACTAGGSAWTSPMPFDTAFVWLHTDTDSTGLLVEIARTDEQRAFGLSRRPSLDPGSGMLFEFDSIQPPDNGFWMWRTNIPLDIAYADTAGVIQRILAMEVCGVRAESCPTYPPGVPYWQALEANIGWFSANGIEVGDRLSVQH